MRLVRILHPVFVSLIALTSAAQSAALPPVDLQADTWVAADTLGRSLPTAAESGPPRTGKAVGAPPVTSPVTLSWSAPGHPESATISEYEIQVFREDTAATNRDWPDGRPGPDLTKSAAGDTEGLLHTYSTGGAAQYQVPNNHLDGGGKLYFWRVRAKDQNNRWSHWSAFYMFKKN